MLPEGHFQHENRAHSFGAKVEGVPLFEGMKLFLGDERVPVYGVYVNSSYSWDPEAKGRTLNGIASISITSGARLTLQTTWVIQGRCHISPLSENVELNFDENYRTVSFEVTKAGAYTIEFRGNRVLHLFVYDLVDYEYNESNCLYFSPGLHDRSNDSRLSGNSIISLSSNTTVFLAEGAIVRGGFLANNATNIKIIGPGFVDGSVFDRNANKNTRLIPFDFNYCSNLEFSSFATIDPAGWCFNLYFCQDIKLIGVKIISSRSNGDGISLQSCQRATVSKCFVRSYDDAIVVKNYPRWDNRAIEGTTDDIEVKDCLIWSDLAQCLEVGYETVGKKMENIRFHDITVIHAFHKAVISIHNANNADIKNVRFENITIEDLQVGRGDGNSNLIDFTVAHSPTWSDQHKVTELGSTNGVSVSNVNVLSGKKTPVINIQGSMETRSSYPNSPHYIENVELRDIVICGEKIGTDYPYFSIAYARDITLDGNPII